MILGGILALVATGCCLAQDLEPRRWSHLPTGANFLGASYLYTEGEISLDPVLRIEDAEFELQSAGIKYIHSFEVFGKSARVDFTQAWQDGTWEGLLNGVPESVDRSGWNDTELRVAMNLFGAPPLAGKEFAQYRATLESETIIGAGLVAVLPTGEYFEDRLINLGGNRFVIRPQLGVVHSRGKWAFEVTTGVSFFTSNDEFFHGNRLEQDPLFLGQCHLIHTFRPGLWLGLSLGYSGGGRSTVNGAEKNDRRNDLAWALSLGVPLSRQWGLKFAYLSSSSRERIGSDFGTFAVAASVMW